MESMPEPPEVPPPLPDIEQMADWIIKHENVATKKPTLEEGATAKLKDQPETYFERRHEVKDKVPAMPDPNIKPMTPISHVLQTRSLLPKPSIPTTQAASTTSRLRKLTKPTDARYASAVLQGFGTAIILIVLTIVILAIKELR